MVARGTLLGLQFLERRIFIEHQVSDWANLLKVETRRNRLHKQCMQCVRRPWPIECRTRPPPRCIWCILVGIQLM